MENESKRRRLFGRRDDRPDAVAEDTTPTLGYFFKLFGRKFGKIFSLNQMMIFQYIPLIAAVLIYVFGDTMNTVQSPLFAPLLGVTLGGGSPTANALIGIYGAPLNIPMLSTGRLVAILILVVITMLTWGWQNVGATYNLRSMVRGDSCFLMSDYVYAIRRNLRQGFFFGLIDFLVIAVLIFDFIWFYMYASLAFFGFMYVLTIALSILYTFMRFYIYHMMITFDLSIRKLLKNALIFAVLGIKRNVMALLGIFVIVALNFLLIVPCMSFGFTLPIILPLFYFPAVAGFIAAYAAYPNIKRYMIDPYVVEEQEDEPSTPPTVG